MTIAIPTGDVCERPCGTCGLAVTHRELRLVPGDMHWSAEKHTAPCGAPCGGGGISADSIRAKVRGAPLSTIAHTREGCRLCRLASDVKP